MSTHGGRSRTISRILVTGASGILGRRVESALAGAGFRGEMVAFCGDVSSRAGIREFLSSSGEFDACLHLAAVVPVQSVEEDPVRAYEVNAIGTGLLASELSESSPDCHFVYCSSSHVYRSSAAPLTEESVTAPVTAYGRSKLAGEYLATDVAARGRISLGVARVFSLFAPDQDPSFLYPATLRRLADLGAGEALEVRGGRNVRDFLHADEVARILATLVLRRVEGVVNVGSGRPMTIVDFVRSIAPSGTSVVEAPGQSERTILVADISRLSRVS